MANGASAPWVQLTQSWPPVVVFGAGALWVQLTQLWPPVVENGASAPWVWRNNSDRQWRQKGRAERPKWSADEARGAPSNVNRRSARRRSSRPQVRSGGVPAGANLRQVCPVGLGHPPGGGQPQGAPSAETRHGSSRSSWLGPGEYAQVQTRGRCVQWSSAIPLGMVSRRACPRRKRAKGAAGAAL